jgi:hypothetical protein
MFHATTDGEKGEAICLHNYIWHHKISNVYNIGEFAECMDHGRRKVKRWTCCGSLDENAPGCQSRPHTCKEMMLSLRAEALPSIRVDNIDLVIYKTIELSIFPGTSYDIKLRITRNLIDLLHKYFSINGMEINDTLVDEVRPQDMTLVKPSEDSTNLQSNPPSPSNLPSASSPQTPEKKYMTMFSRNKSIRNFQERTESVEREGLRESRISSLSKTPAKVKLSSSYVDLGDATLIAPSTASNPARQEAVFIRYLRVGDIFVDITTSGFPLNLTNYKAVVDPFFCRGEVIDWHSLVLKLERHAKLSVAKHTASNSLSKLGNMLFLKSTPNKMDPSLSEKMSTNDEQASLLLGQINKKESIGNSYLRRFLTSYGTSNKISNITTEEENAQKLLGGR